jgi:hypothetical protein
VSLTPVANLPTTQEELVAKFAASVVDTGGKFAASVVDTSGSFATVVIDTSGKFATGVVDVSGALWLANISRNFRNKFEMTQKLFWRVWGKVIHKKTWSKKSRDTVHFTGAAT